jgi:hypothetical protein
MKQLTLITLFLFASMVLNAQSVKNKLNLKGTYYAKELEGIKYLEHDSYITFINQSEGYIEHVYEKKEKDYHCKCTNKTFFTYSVKKDEITYYYSSSKLEPILVEGSIPEYIQLCCTATIKLEGKSTNKIWRLNPFKIQIGGLTYIKTK